MKIPKALGAKVDMCLKLRDERLELAKRVAEFKKQEKVLSDLIVEGLQHTQAEKITGKLATFSFKSVRIGKVTDWSKFYAYIKKSGNFDLLPRSVANGPYREHLEAGDKMQGIAMDSIIKTSLTRV